MRYSHDGEKWREREKGGEGERVILFPPPFHHSPFPPFSHSEAHGIFKTDVTKMLTRILALIRKEFIHIRRDFRTLIIIFLMPLVQLLMFGYAINMEIQQIDLAIIDDARTPAS